MDYLLKSTICLTAFYGLYFFGFRRMSFHTLNRFYLLASLALSLTIPLLSYERTEIIVLEPQAIEETAFHKESIQENTYSQVPIIQQSANVEESSKVNIDWMQVISTIYLIGVGFMLILFIKNLLTIFYSIRSALVASSETSPASLSHQSHQKLKILLTKNQSNSSFFNYIFLNPDNLTPHEQNLIIAHEGFHSQRLHTLDLLLSSILKAVFWFNPIIYFYQKSLKQIHEYEVDALMSAAYDGREYAHLLLKLGVAPNALIINQFSTKPLSERIQFLFKTPTKNMKKLLYFLSLPIIAVGIMAFAEEKVVRVYQEKNDSQEIKSVEVKEYPLVINDKANYGSWTDIFNKPRFSERDISLNELTTKNYNGFHYLVNPNSLTINTIKQVNKYIKRRSLELIITESEIDRNGNLTKLGLAVKHLTSKQTTATEFFDMAELREKGKSGAYVFIEAYDKNFKESNITFRQATGDLIINFGEKEMAVLIGKISDLNISRKKITYKVSPDKLNLATFEKVKNYFAKEGFTLKVNNPVFDKNHNLLSVEIQLENGKETSKKQIILDDLRHLVKSKNRPESNHRWDETIIIEANKITKETKVFVDNRWLESIKKSDKFEILRVVNNTTQQNLNNFTHKIDFNLNFTRIDSVAIYADNKVLIEGQDYIVKDKHAYLDQKYEKSKVGIRIVVTNIGGPGSYYLYPNLTKLEENTYPIFDKIKTLPIFTANKESKIIPQFTSKLPKLPTPFSKVAKDQDTLRTILETNKLGKNPLVFINGEEYPSSILYRINPDAVVSMVIPRTNGEKLVDKYGEKAKDGIVRISTKKNVDFLLKNEKEYQIVLENIKNLMLPTKGRVKRVLLKDLNGRITEKVSIIDTKTGFDKISMRTDVGKKAIFFIDNVLVSEEDVNNYNGDLFHDGYKNEIIEEKYPKEVKSADMVFNLKTKRN